MLEAVVIGAAVRRACHHPSCAPAAGTSGLEIDIALFVDRLDRHHDCDTWLGAHLLRMQCTYRVAGMSDSIIRQARTLSGLTWLRPMKASLFSCEMPSEVLTAEGETEVYLQDLDYGWKVPFVLCGSKRPERPAALKKENITICTEPFHSISPRTAHLFRDSLAYHIRQGAMMDVYDLDGSAASVVKPFVAKGRARYFPYFPEKVSAHVGELALDGRSEAADGCSCGLQEMHCLLRNRGRSRWIVPRLDPDEFFAPGRSTRRHGNTTESTTGRNANLHCTQAFQDFLPSGRFGSIATSQEIGAVFISSIEFGGRLYAGRSSPAYERFQRRTLTSTPRWISVVNPDNALSTHLHTVRPRPGARTLDFAGLRLHHYLDAFGYLKRGFLGTARTNFQSRDDHLARRCPARN
jgi:hypothetical protein